MDWRAPKPAPSHANTRLRRKHDLSHADAPEPGSAIGAQVAHAAIHERALHLDDVLLRRLQLGMGKHRVGSAVDHSADIMARLLGWDAARRTDEIARYLAALYPPATPQTKAQGQ